MKGTAFSFGLKASHKKAIRCFACFFFIYGSGIDLFVISDSGNWPRHIHICSSVNATVFSVRRGWGRALPAIGAHIPADRANGPKQMALRVNIYSFFSLFMRLNWIDVLFLVFVPLPTLKNSKSRIKYSPGFFTPHQETNLKKNKSHSNAFPHETNGNRMCMLFYLFIHN